MKEEGNFAIQMTKVPIFGLDCLEGPKSFPHPWHKLRLLRMGIPFVTYLFDERIVLKNQ
jgi:hypothetical protein